MAKNKKRFDKKQAHMDKKSHRKQRRVARDAHHAQQELKIEKARKDGPQLNYRVTRATLDSIFNREPKSPSGLRVPNDRELKELTIFADGHPCKPIEARYHKWNGGTSEFMQKGMRDIFYMLSSKYKTLFTENILDNHSFVQGCIRLCEVHDFWVREPKDWKPNSRNPARRFHSLMNHLLCTYPVPEFMVSVMVPGDLDTRYWVSQIGRGESPKNVLGERVDVTKRIAHLWMKTSSKLTWVQGLRRAQAESCGGTPAQAEEFTKVRTFASIDRSKTEEAFRFTQIQWFANNPMIASDQINPMLDYLDHLRADWDTDEQGPFVMTGRGANRIFQDMQVWHADLNARRALHARNNRGAYVYYQGSYEPAGLKKGSFEVGPKRVKWNVVEILNTKELNKEGVALHHCIASYSNRIHEGRCSIWSLRKSDMPIVTIEVDQGGTIVQCRGACNRLPDKKEMQLIAQWAQQNNLMMGRYV